MGYTMKTKKNRKAFTMDRQKAYFYRTETTEDFETISNEVINNGVNYDDFNAYQEDINALIDTFGGNKLW